MDAPKRLPWGKLFQRRSIPVSRIFVHIIAPPGLDAADPDIAVVGKLETEEYYDGGYR